jgi:TetR/AcrR family transcriptional regulator, transcriptional repressor for nem operon
MRYRPEHKPQTRKRILGAAGTLLRRAGVSGASVERVMSRAGLTVGGFYGHFASKRALVGEALRALFARQRAEWLSGLSGLRGEAWLDLFVRRYLSRRHRDLTSEGCPIPAVLTELPRAGAAARRALDEELTLLAAEMESRLAVGPSPQARARALGTLALCFGGLALSRAVQDHALSDEILLACRATALQPLGAAKVAAPDLSPTPNEEPAWPTRPAPEPSPGTTRSRRRPRAES